MRTFRDQRLYDRGGRYIWARVRDEHGRIRRRSTGCTDEKAAVAWCNEQERRFADPAHKRASEATLKTALADWCAELERRKTSAVTYSITKAKLGHFVRVWGDEWPMSRVDNALVLAYIDQRLSEPGNSNKTVTRHTVRKELSELRRLLEWSRFLGAFAKDPATVIPPGFSAQHKPRSRWLTEEEAGKLLHTLTLGRAAHVAYILATGARRGESFRARREDVHLDDLFVDVRGTKTERAAGTVPITGITHPYIVFALQHAPGRTVLFQPWGKMNRDLHAACKRAGIAPVSPNDLRRTFGKWHRLAGVSAEHVSILLRHATDKLAQTTYARVTGRDIGAQIRTAIPVRQSVSDLYPALPPSTDSVAVDAEDAANEASKTAEELGVPGQTRTVDPRFRKPGYATRSKGNDVADVVEVWSAVASSDVSDLYAGLELSSETQSLVATVFGGTGGVSS